MPVASGSRPRRHGAPELDQGVALALASGARGARLVAGGFGGFALALVEATGTAELVGDAAVAAYAPAEIRGSAFGLLAAVQSFGNFAASGIAGLLWTAAGPSWAFAYLTGWMILAAVLLTRVPPRPTPSMTRLGADRG